jgi:hypothetical protein
MRDSEPGPTPANVDADVPLFSPTRSSEPLDEGRNSLLRLRVTFSERPNMPMRHIRSGRWACAATGHETAAAPPSNLMVG